MGERILVVDDEQEIAGLVEVYLKSENYTVVKAGNAQTALRLIEQEPPDILIRAGADGIGGLDFFKAKAILAAAEPIKDEVKRALERALEARG